MIILVIMRIPVEVAVEVEWLEVVVKSVLRDLKL